MGFRDLVDGIRTVKDPVSVNYDMKNASESSGNEPLLFSEIIESPGQRAVTNILTRHRLCEAFNVEPGEYLPCKVLFNSGFIGSLRIICQLS